jgi:kynurenine 3-monooxygenase
MAYAAGGRRGVAIFTGTELVGVDAATGTLELEAVGSGERTRLQAERIIAADGAFSAVRQSLVEAGLLESLRREVPYGYTEMPIPAAPGGGWAMANHGMHLWPRGNFLLTAFPTVDGQFASTLVLPQQGEPSVASLRTPEHLVRLFEREFPDALPLFPHVAEAYFARPSSSLTTITCQRWTFGGRVALLGDAAHAMVPFLGQGMNAALEDCTVLARCMEEQGHHWPSAIARYEALRKPNADAITQLSLQHFTELAENSLTPEFRQKKRLEQRLYQLFPDSFVPLYPRLAFSLLPYHEVALRSARQEELLQRLLRLEDVERRLEEPAFLDELRNEVGRLASLPAAT